MQSFFCTSILYNFVSSYYVTMFSYPIGALKWLLKFACKLSKGPFFPSPVMYIGQYGTVA